MRDDDGILRRGNSRTNSMYNNARLGVSANGAPGVQNKLASTYNNPNIYGLTAVEQQVLDEGAREFARFQNDKKMASDLETYNWAKNHRRPEGAPTRFDNNSFYTDGTTAAQIVRGEDGVARPIGSQEQRVPATPPVAEKTPANTFDAKTPLSPKNLPIFPTAKSPQQSAFIAPQHSPVNRPSQDINAIMDRAMPPAALPQFDIFKAPGAAPNVVPTSVPQTTLLDTPQHSPVNRSLGVDAIMDRATPPAALPQFDIFKAPDTPLRTERDALSVEQFRRARNKVGDIYSAEQLAQPSPWEKAAMFTPKSTFQTPDLMDFSAMPTPKTNRSRSASPLLAGAPYSAEQLARPSPWEPGYIRPPTPAKKLFGGKPTWDYGQVEGAGGPRDDKAGTKYLPASGELASLSNGEAVITAKTVREMNEDFFDGDPKGVEKYQLATDPQASPRKSRVANVGGESALRDFKEKNAQFFSGGKILGMKNPRKCAGGRPLADMDAAAYAGGKPALDWAKDKLTTLRHRYTSIPNDFGKPSALRPEPDHTPERKIGVPDAKKTNAPGKIKGAIKAAPGAATKFATKASLSLAPAYNMSEDLMNTSAEDYRTRLQHLPDWVPGKAHALKAQNPNATSEERLLDDIKTRSYGALTEAPTAVLGVADDTVNFLGGLMGADVGMDTEGMFRNAFFKDTQGRGGASAPGSKPLSERLFGGDTPSSRTKSPLTNPDSTDRRVEQRTVGLPQIDEVEARRAAAMGHLRNIQPSISDMNRAVAGKNMVATRDQSQKTFNDYNATELQMANLLFGGSTGPLSEETGYTTDGVGTGRTGTSGRGSKGGNQYTTSNTLVNDNVERGRLAVEQYEKLNKDALELLKDEMDPIEAAQYLQDAPAHLTSAERARWALNGKRVQSAIRPEKGQVPYNYTDPVLLDVARRAITQSANPDLGEGVSLDETFDKEGLGAAIMQAGNKIPFRRDNISLTHPDIGGLGYYTSASMSPELMQAIQELQAAQRVR